MKTTIDTCDTCGRTLSGTGWSTLWAKAGRRHYCCAKCLVRAEFQEH